MGWHEAYLTQARSDHRLLGNLGKRGKDVEYCHRLHYLQMATEKLAKAILTPRGGTDPAQTSHVMFVRMLQTLKRNRRLRRLLGYGRATAAFTNYIDSLLDLAARVEQLSPDQAGFTRPNPEYPWRSHGSQAVLAPVEYDFPEFNPRDPRMVKLEALVSDLLRLV